jgi:hypothetical protein
MDDLIGAKIQIYFTGRAAVRESVGGNFNLEKLFLVPICPQNS